MERLFSHDSKWSRMLQIDPVDFSDWEHIPRGERRRRSRTKVRILVASLGRQPIWLELPMVMHRPLPEGSAVKAAEIIRRRVGTHFTYALALTVHIESAKEVGAAAGPTVAIAFGWQRRGGGLRVAVCLGSDGSRDELVLPTELLDRFQTLERVRSIRALEHHKAVEEIRAWVLEQRSGDLPQWLTQSLADQMDAPETMTAIALYWLSHRFSGDDHAFSALEAWRRRDKRLLEWQANLREKCLGHRSNIYRKFAHHKAQLYSRVVIYEPQLNKVRQRPMPETREGPLGVSMRRLTQIAAIYTLETAIEQEFSKVEKEVSIAPRGLQVWKHFACHKGASISGADPPVVRCPSCSQLFDPELNACRHLIEWSDANA